jgi:hypothetical protein
MDLRLKGCDVVAYVNLILHAYVPRPHIMKREERLRRGGNAR